MALCQMMAKKHVAVLTVVRPIVYTLHNGHPGVFSMIRVKADKSDAVVTLRLPALLKVRLQRAAEVNNRSLTDFVLSHAQTAADSVLAVEQAAA